MEIPKIHFQHLNTGKIKNENLNENISEKTKYL